MIFRLVAQSLWLCQSLSLRHLSFQRRGLAAVGTGVKRFQLDEKDITESFARGSGPGGQKINKSKNCVHLVHIPTGISVNCQDARDLTTNRKLARKWLADKVDLALHGDNSKLGKKFEKIRKRKRSAARKSKRKYQADGCPAEAADDDDESSESSESSDGSDADSLDEMDEAVEQSSQKASR